MTPNYVEQLCPILRDQMDQILLAQDGVRVFMVLAGCFPTDATIQAAFLTVAHSQREEVYRLLSQVAESDESSSRVIEAAKRAHRNLDAESQPFLDIERPKRIVFGLINTAIWLEPRVAYIPPILNKFDRKDMRRSQENLAIELEYLIRR